MASDAIATVHAWHAALNAGDVERLLALSSDDVEVGGPRGSGRGAQVLREWFGRAAVQMEVSQTFHRNDRDDTVVVEQRATWQIPGTETADSPHTVASVFVVKDGRVASVIRHADLASALAAGGLTYADKV